MRTYRLSGHYCWRAAVRRAAFAVAVVLLAVGASALFLASRSALTWRSTWPLSLCSLLAVVGLGIPLGAWRMRAVSGSCRLILDEDRLTQSMRGANDVTVGRGEVTEIIETPATSLVVRTAERRRWIIVFDGLEEYADLRARLAEWRDIKTLPARSPLSPVLRQAAILSPTACLLAAFLSSNPYVVVPFASAGAAAMVVVLWMMQRSLHAPVWAKVLSWAVLAPIALMVVRIAMVCRLIGKW